jgi:hypothetical protein
MRDYEALARASLEAAVDMPPDSAQQREYLGRAQALAILALVAEVKNIAGLMH